MLLGILFFYLFWFTQKGKFFKPIEKISCIVPATKALFWGSRRFIYFFLLYFTLVLLLIRRSQPASIAWTVTSTVAFYHCWSETKHSHLLWFRCEIFLINMVCPYDIYIYIYIYIYKVYMHIYNIYIYIYIYIIFQINHKSRFTPIKNDRKQTIQVISSFA